MEGGRRRGGSQHGMVARAWSESRTPCRPAGQSRCRSALFDSGPADDKGQHAVGRADFLRSA